jgi:hypothetical protein
MLIIQNRHNTFSSRLAVRVQNNFGMEMEINRVKKLHYFDRITLGHIKLLITQGKIFCRLLFR